MTLDEKCKCPADLDCWNIVFVTSLEAHLLSDFELNFVLKVGGSAWDTDFKIGIDV